MSGGGAVAGITTVELTQNYPISSQFKKFGETISELSQSSAASVSSTSDDTLFNFATITNFFKIVGEYLALPFTSSGDVINIIYGFLSDWNSTKDGAKQLYVQFKEWTEFFRKEWDSFKPIASKIWETRWNTVSLLWKLVKERQEDFKKVVNLISKNREGAFKMISLVVQESGGWSHVSDWLFVQKRDQWDSWMKTIGEDWSIFEGIFKFSYENADQILSIKSNICGGSDSSKCKDIFNAVIAEGWENIKSGIQKISPTDGVKLLFNKKLITELKDNSSAWKQIIQKAQSKISEIIQVVKKEEGKNALTLLFGDGKKDKLFKAWELFSGNNASANNDSTFLVAKNLQTVVFEELLDNFEQNLPKLVALVDFVSSPPLSGFKNIELTEDSIRGFFKVKPGTSQAVYFLMNHLGVPVSNEQSGLGLASRAISNLLGTLLDHV